MARVRSQETPLTWILYGCTVSRDLFQTKSVLTLFNVLILPFPTYIVIDREGITRERIWAEPSAATRLCPDDKKRFMAQVAPRYKFNCFFCACVHTGQG